MDVFGFHLDGGEMFVAFLTAFVCAGLLAEFVSGVLRDRRERKIVRSRLYRPWWTR